MTSRNHKFFMGKYRSFLTAAAILYGAFAARADYSDENIATTDDSVRRRGRRGRLRRRWRRRWLDWCKPVRRQERQRHGDPRLQADGPWRVVVERLKVTTHAG